MYTRKRPMTSQMSITYKTVKDVTAGLWPLAFYIFVLIQKNSNASSER